MEVTGQIHALVALPSGGKNCTPWIASWVGPKAGLDAMAKKKNPLAPAANRTSVFHPVP
jgi:hypothetical protein